MANDAKREVAHRQLELEVLRDSLLRYICPALVRLVPVVDFWKDPPEDLIRFANGMNEIESRLLEMTTPALPIFSDESRDLMPSIESGKAGKSGDRQVDDRTVEEKALAILVQHPDWENPQIAKEGNFHVKSLSRKRTPRFYAARDAIEAGREERARGAKYNGDVESSYEDDLDSDW